MLNKEKELCYKCLTEANDVYHLAYHNKKKNAKFENEIVTDEYITGIVTFNEKDMELEQRSYNLLNMLEELYNMDAPYGRR